MGEALKNRIIIILSVTCVMFMAVMINSCNSAYQQKLGRDKEMSKRLDMEEKLSNISAGASVVERKLEESIKKLEEEKLSHEATKDTLQQQRQENQALKEELEKLTKLKQALEEDLKEALVVKEK